MDAIRRKCESDAAAVTESLPAKYLALQEFVATITEEPASLAAKFAVTPSDTAPVPMNATVATALERTQAEVSAAIASFGIIQSWLTLSLPAVEDGNNFGVGVVLEAIKMVGETKKALAEQLKGLPDYFKERSAAVEKISPKLSASTSESSTSSSDKETKAAEVTDSTKSGTSTVTKKDTATSSAVPDAVAHVVALDVNWYLRLHETCGKVMLAYASVSDFIEKNKDRISQPKGSGGRMSMY